MIQKYLEIIENTLQEYFDVEINNPKNCYTKTLFESMKYTTCLGGKRLRAMLCLESCRIFSNDYKTAIPTAMALEMLHAQSLIHDDLPCMDNDDLRRGKPSNHKVFGEAMAVLAGDALVSYAPQIILEKTNAPNGVILKVLDGYFKASGAFGIVGGQVADIEAEKSDKAIEFENLKYIHSHKTGALFEYALVSGAILGGANEVQLASITEFAKTFGLAFQVLDDVLDVISTTEAMGKTIGKDEAAQKSTYVTIFGLETAILKFKELIQKSYAIMDENKIDSNVFREILKSMENKVER